MLKNNNYCYNDKYMYFNFNGIYSKKYNLFITNNGADLKFVTNPNASTNFSTPMYQNSSYNLGTNKPQLTISINVAAEGLTLNKFKEMMSWLNIGTTGFLVFDNNPYWGYNVVLTSTGEAIQYVSSNDFSIELKIEFKTIGDWCAKSRFNSNTYIGITPFRNTSESDNENRTLLEQTVANEYGIPEIDFIDIDDSKTTRTIRIIDVSNQHTFINYSYYIPNNINGKSNLMISYNNKVYINYLFAMQPENFSVKYNGEYAYIIINDSNLAESMSYTEHALQESGILSINTNQPKKLSNDIKVDDLNDYILTLTSEEYYDTSESFFIAAVEIDDRVSNIYGFDWNKNMFPINYKADIYYCKKSDISQDSYTIKLKGKGSLGNRNFTYSSKTKYYIGTYNDIIIVNNKTSDENKAFLEVLKHNNL